MGMIKQTVFSDQDDKSLAQFNLMDDYSLKNQDLDMSIDSGESEFPNDKDSINIKMVYEKRKFII
jgi:hypothetical protein